MVKKFEVRSDFKKILKNLDKRWITAASTALCDQITALIDSNLDFDIEHILCFSSFFPGEADLTYFIGEQLSKRSLYLPVVHPDGRMTFISINSDWQKRSQPGVSGLPEPLIDSGQPYDLSNAAQTVILVPGIAFDRFGNRLGRGKGYYDRFLSRPYMREAIKIGIGWEIQLIDEVPTESHDIMMDWVCHERGKIKTTVLFEEE